MDRLTIHEFTGAEYQEWASKMQHALIEKDLHSMVFDFRGMARKPRPAVVGPLTKAKIVTREAEIYAWDKLDLRAQIFIVNHLGFSPCSHVARRRCEHAYETWNVSSSLCGEVCNHCGMAGHASEDCHKRSVDLDGAAEFAARSET